MMNANQRTVYKSKHTESSHVYMNDHFQVLQLSGAICSYTLLMSSSTGMQPVHPGSYDSVLALNVNGACYYSTRSL